MKIGDIVYHTEFDYFAVIHDTLDPGMGSPLLYVLLELGSGNIAHAFEDELRIEFNHAKSA